MAQRGATFSPPGPDNCLGVYTSFGRNGPLDVTHDNESIPTILRVMAAAGSSSEAAAELGMPVSELAARLVDIRAALGVGSTQEAVEMIADPDPCTSD